jgi:hypothetical protein
MARLTILLALVAACGGSHDPGGSFHATLSALSADANTGPLPFDASDQVLGDIYPDGTFSFTGDNYPSGVVRGRSVNLSVRDTAGSSPVAGNRYIVAPPPLALGHALVTFTETDTSGERDWTASVGTITIASASGARVSLTFAGATMQPANSAAKGTFTLDGTCTVAQTQPGH